MYVIIKRKKEKISCKLKMAVIQQQHNRSKVEESISSTDGVDDLHRHDIAMHRPGRLERLFAILSCRSRCSIGNSVHFHADHVEDVRIVYVLSLQ